MKIAIISDIHDNIEKLNLFFEKIKTLEIEKILFLGDLASASTALILSKSKIPVFSILGNNNGDLCRIMKMENDNFKQSSKNFDFLEIDEKKIFLTHYDEIAKHMAKSGDFDAVFYGHNHLKHKEFIGNCLLLNPGEIVGSRTSISSFAIYDSTKNNAEIIDIK